MGKTLAWRNAWSIPEMTLQTQAAVEELDREKRAHLYQTSQRLHQKNSPFVILFQQIEQNAMQKSVENFYPGSAVTAASYRFVTK